MWGSADWKLDDQGLTVPSVWPLLCKFIPHC